MTEGAARAIDALGVSRETAARLDLYAAHLRKWNRAINLIGPSTLDTLWTRHILDSGQLWPLAPAGARSWLDLGAGAGLPALIIAILAMERRPDLAVTAIESDARKCAFLRDAARAVEAPLTVVTARIEAAAAADEHDVISARALAPLPHLLALADRFRAPGAVFLFPKGRTARSELTEARKSWHMEVETLPSVTDPSAAILRITNLRAARSDG